MKKDVTISKTKLKVNTLKMRQNCELKITQNVIMKFDRESYNKKMENKRVKKQKIKKTNI